MMSNTDVRHLLSSIAVPCLLIVRRGCPVYDPGLGEYLAEHLPDVTVERQHDVNEPWWIGDTNFVRRAFERFIGQLSLLRR